MLAPIFTLWFGLGIWSKVALGITLVFFIVFFNVYQGVKEVSPTVLANARMLGMNELQLLRVEHPAAKFAKVAGGALETEADPSKLRFFDRERGGQGTDFCCLPEHAAPPHLPAPARCVLARGPALPVAQPLLSAPWRWAQGASSCIPPVSTFAAASLRAAGWPTRRLWRPAKCLCGRAAWCPCMRCSSLEVGAGRDSCW